MNLFKKDKEKNDMIQKKEEYTHPLSKFQRRMERLFEDFFDEWDLDLSSESRSLSSVSFSPKVNIEEDDKAIYIDAELPGLNEKDINVELKNNTLTISGEKKIEKEDKNKKYHRVERSYGYFQRSLPIGKEILEDDITANFKNGVLSITLPKDSKKQIKSKKININ